MKALFAAGLMAMTIAAVPASAQPWGGGDYRWQARALCDGSRADALHRRIRQERIEGDLNPGQAANMNRHIAMIEQNADRYCANGLGPSEARYLDSEYDNLEMAINDRDDDYGRHNRWSGGYRDYRGYDDYYRR
ncbi:hypothetical protein [Flavisphingomonas formosensis]|uniref:hypothetical protein n=1 Tax=Flavisphingomonas formosensis TaxID=861534 RepID=UPI0012F9A1D7|nr:hypothetical protein [Sphingomonas formosensis]